MLRPAADADLVEEARTLLERDYRSDPRFVARMLVELSAHYYRARDRAKQFALLVRAEAAEASVGKDGVVATLKVTPASVKSGGAFTQPWLAFVRPIAPSRSIATATSTPLFFAQAVGRFGNWFNNELHGAVTTLPWGLEVHRMDPANPGRARISASSRTAEVLDRLTVGAPGRTAVPVMGPAVCDWITPSARAPKT